MDGRTRDGFKKVNGISFLIKERAWDRKRKKIMKASGVENWPHNALRHTFVRSRLAVTKNPVETAYESGHIIGIMKSHYDAIVDPMDGKEHFSIEIALLKK